MLPRLQAEERLNAITDGAVAAGSMEPDEQSNVLSSLREAAQIRKAKPARASSSVLAEMGIASIVPAAAAEKAVSDG